MMCFNVIFSSPGQTRSEYKTAIQNAIGIHDRWYSGRLVSVTKITREDELNPPIVHWYKTLTASQNLIYYHFILIFEISTEDWQRSDVNGLCYDVALFSKVKVAWFTSAEFINEQGDYLHNRLKWPHLHN